MLMHLPENDPEAQARIRALLGGLQQLGWTEGRNLRIDYRLGAADVDRARRYAAELIALAPDVIQASGTGPMAALHEATRTVPIVFAQIPDPVSAGFVDSLSRPGGNATGFSVFGRRGNSYTIWGLLHLQAEITLAINLAPLEARQACSITGAPWKLESRT
jgi:putative ABC transport system substrate-binding protein